MNLLVTGGAGFIGSHFVDELVKQGHKIKIIDNLSTGRKEYLNPGAEFFESDIRDFEKIRPVFDGVEMVFHLAAQARIQPSIANPRESNGNNIDGTLTVLIATPTVNIPPRDGEARDTLADIGKAKELLGWEPRVHIEEGIKNCRA